jgi:hypothetical protein
MMRMGQLAAARVHDESAWSEPSGAGVRGPVERVARGAS